MGDILTGIIGGGQQTNQTTRPDATSRALNQMNLQELRQLFKTGDMADFARPNTDDFTLSGRTQALINRATDPSNLMSLDQYMRHGLDEGRGYIRKVATPEIMSALTLQGMERSGAVPESIAKATAGIALPFLTSIPSFQAGSAQTASALAGLSDMPRALRASDFLRRQGIVQTGFTDIPFVPGSSSTGGTSSLPLGNLFGMGGSL